MATTRTALSSKATETEWRYHSSPKLASLFAHRHHNRGRKRSDNDGDGDGATSKPNLSTAVAEDATSRRRRRHREVVDLQQHYRHGHDDNREEGKTQQQQQDEIISHADEPLPSSSRNAKKIIACMKSDENHAGGGRVDGIGTTTKSEGSSFFRFDFDIIDDDDASASRKNRNGDGFSFDFEVSSTHNNNSPHVSTLSKTQQQQCSKGSRKKRKKKKKNKNIKKGSKEDGNKNPHDDDNQSNNGKGQQSHDYSADNNNNQALTDAAGAKNGHHDNYLIDTTHSSTDHPTPAANHSNYMGKGDGDPSKNDASNNNGNYNTFPLTPQRIIPSSMKEERVDDDKAKNCTTPLSSPSPFSFDPVVNQHHQRSAMINRQSMDMHRQIRRSTHGTTTTRLVTRSNNPFTFGFSDILPPATTPATSLH